MAGPKMEPLAAPPADAPQMEPLAAPPTAELPAPPPEGAAEPQAKG
jgi:hypothetical protein